MRWGLPFSKTRKKWWNVMGCDAMQRNSVNELEILLVHIEIESIHTCTSMHICRGCLRPVSLYKMWCIHYLCSRQRQPLLLVQVEQEEEGKVSKCGTAWELFDMHASHKLHQLKKHTYYSKRSRRRHFKGNFSTQGSRYST